MSIKASSPKVSSIATPATNRTVRVGRMVRMHANDREDITDAGPGDIVALLAVDCASGDTLCGEGINYSLESIFVADPVISLSITPASSADQERMAKALNRFMKEDPTFRVSTDPETGETVIAGMGELHLDVYIERMRREFKAQVTVGAPNVSYRGGADPSNPTSITATRSRPVAPASSGTSSVA